MPEFIIQCTQAFNCTYRVEADTEDEAWATLIDNGEAECVDRSPGEIVSTREESSIEEDA